MTNEIVAKLLKLKLEFPACLLLSAVSLLKGRFSVFRLVEHEYWVQKQKGIVFVNRSPERSLKAVEIREFCEDVYFNSYTPQSGDVCVDVGAGIGTETCMMSHLAGKNGRVFAIEACPKTYRALELCIKYNRLKNVTASNCAISNVNGIVGITDDLAHHIANTITNNAGEGCSMVESITMDDYLSKHGIELIDYLKINIEGAETLLLQAFGKIKDVRHIAISTHDFLGRRNRNEALFTSKAVREFLEANNFEIYTRTTNIDYQDGWIYGKNKAFRD